MEATLAAELNEAPPDLEATLEADEAAEESEDEIEDAALCAAAEALDAEALGQVSKVLVTGRANSQPAHQALEEATDAAEVALAPAWLA